MSLESTTQAAGRKSPWRRLASVVLVALALAYLAWVLKDEAQSIGDAFASIAPWKIAVATLCATGMCLLKAIYHRQLLLRITARGAHADQIIPAYAQAQVVRYLPGKFWGLLHQANQLSSLFSVHEVMLANVLQMLATNLMSIGVIVSILGAALLGSAWPLLGLPLTLALIELLHRKPLLDRYLVRLVVSLGRGRFGTAELATLPIKPVRWLGTLVLSAEWLAYYAMWWAATEGLIGLESALTLGTWYAAASLLSILAIAVPAGLVVREAIFVSLAGMGSYPQGLVIALAAALRVIMTLGDLLCVPLTLVHRRMAGGRGG